MKRFCFISFWVFLVAAAVCPAIAEACVVDGPGWHIAGRADFNGDGNPDILWRNQSTGEMAVWYMSGSALLSEHQFTTAPDSAWDVVGVGDFNGDGSPDILLRNQFTGDVRVWYLKGPAVIGQDSVAKVGGDWDIFGAGDFNGDGSPDILWRNSATGETIVWYMKGICRLGAKNLEALPPPWHIIGINDFDRDGSPDILWKNSTTGDVVVWHMRGSAHVDYGSITARAPPLTGVCYLSGDLNPDNIRSHVSKVSDICPRLIPGLPQNIIVSSPHIRAPPILAV